MVSITMQAPAAAGESSPQWLAEVCIATCLLLKRPDALLSDVFPRWQPSPFLGAFLEQLEPHILRDQLPSLAPEVGQGHRRMSAWGEGGGLVVGGMARRGPDLPGWPSLGAYRNYAPLFLVSGGSYSPKLRRPNLLA